MRSALTMMVGLAVFTAACGGKTDNTNTSTTGSSTTGSSTTGGSTTGGTTTGGTTTAAGTTTGGTTGLPNGSACTSDTACGSGVCGINHTGLCCASTCNVPAGSPCGAIGCDSSGTCVYPVTDAGAILCSGTCAKSQFNGVFCDTAGGCTVTTGVAALCSGNYACESPSSCKTTCTAIADCAPGFYCDNGQCLAQTKFGPCSENDACTSLVCDITGAGECCKNACVPTADPACSATTCSATNGACIYPDGGACGAPTCTNSMASAGGVCDATGKCVTNPQPCANNLGCNTGGTGCNSSCTTRADCASGFYCDNDAGGCIPEIATGTCFENDECTSGFCGVGVGGTGNCCAQQCLSTDPLCGASACDVTSGACNYPPTTTLCGSVDPSCANGVEQPASACDGKGTCNATPPTQNCTPFICGTNACLNTCSDNTACAANDFCDVTNGSCCPGLVSGKVQSLSVDSAAGSDATACCGYGSAGACATITQAMKLIDEAQAPNLTINAKVSGGAGDWKVKTEVYPIVLGWGVELNAPGVYFFDPNQTGAAQLFDINLYSANDTIGYASIVGAAKKQVGIGLDTKNDATAQSNEQSMVQVESGNTLYIANANLNSSWTSNSTAITVIGGGTLTLGQDQSAAVTGTVTIGNALGAQETDGWNGIVCTNNGGTGCTITDDATLLAGTSSIVIEGQENLDIDAEDFANITLSSAPTIGIAPTAPGFLECPNTTSNVNGGKPDAFSSGNYPFGQAVLLNGDVTMTFKGSGAVQCISGYGFVLQGTSNGVPTLTLDSTTVQNTEWGLVANAGKATVTNSTFQYNYNGVEQNNDGIDPDATVDLSGGGNTMICTSSAESTVNQNTDLFEPGSLDPGVDVAVTTTSALAADNSTWDTKTPDQFSCTDNSFSSCTCEVPSCTDKAGQNGMDAVYTGTGTVTTTKPTLSTASCAVTCGKQTCTSTQICCPTSICTPQICADTLQDCQDSCF